MKKLIFAGIFAMLFLMLIPFVFALSSDLCENISENYKADCAEIINLDLTNDDKTFLIEHLKDSYSMVDVQTYSGLFSGNLPTATFDNLDYDPKKNIDKKFLLISNLILLFFVNYFLYCILKKCCRSVKWNAE